MKRAVVALALLAAACSTHARTQYSEPWRPPATSYVPLPPCHSARAGEICTVCLDSDADKAEAKRLGDPVTCHVWSTAIVNPPKETSR